eukprot:1172528-Rhodomonas_salina.2
MPSYQVSLLILRVIGKRFQRRLQKKLDGRHRDSLSVASVGTRVKPSPTSHRVPGYRVPGYFLVTSSESRLDHYPGTRVFKRLDQTAGFSRKVSPNLPKAPPTPSAPWHFYPHPRNTRTRVPGYRGTYPGPKGTYYLASESGVRRRANLLTSVFG